MSELPISFQTLTANAGLVVIVAHFIEHLKRSRWFPLLDPYTDSLNKLFAMVCAVATAVGMQLTFTTAGDHATVALSGIPVTLGAALQMAVHVAANYGGIKAYYHATMKVPS